MAVAPVGNRPRRAVIVGLGGIGSWLVQALAPYLQFLQEAWTIVLVDGDEYEAKNASRQAFDGLGSKAQVQASWIARRFSGVRVEVIAQYISADGADGTLPINDAIRSGDIVFSCVDNHRTRKVISDCCANLRDMVLISGGNEYLDGNVQVFVRRQGQDLTCRLEKYHPELAVPTDKAPYELSCEELTASSPQLIFANFAAASLMLQAFYALEQGRFEFAKSEVYFDVMSVAATPRTRNK